jgi:hypothetical protein
MNKMIQSSDYASVVAESFDVLVDPNPPAGVPPVIGLKVDPYEGQSFIMPIRYEAAADIAQCILQTLSHVAPHLLVKLLQKEMI